MKYETTRQTLSYASNLYASKLFKYKTSTDKWATLSIARLINQNHQGKLTAFPVGTDRSCHYTICYLTSSLGKFTICLIIELTAHTRFKMMRKS